MPSSGCPSDHYPKDANWECTKCDPSCLTCDKGTDKDCTSCDFYLHLG